MKRGAKLSSAHESVSEAATVRLATNNYNDIFTPEHERLLEEELQLLTQVLKRNRASHQRTKYFQYTRMALRSIQQGFLLHKTLQRKKQQQQQMQQQLARNKKQQELFWSMDQTTTHSLASINSDQSTNIPKNETAPCRTTTTTSNPVLDDTTVLLLEHLVTSIQRCDRAVESIVPEIARGFFVPLQTVLLAAMARMRTLILLCGRQQPCLLLSSSSSPHNNNTTTMRNYFFPIIPSSKNDAMVPSSEITSAAADHPTLRKKEQPQENHDDDDESTTDENTNHNKNDDDDAALWMSSSTKSFLLEGTSDVGEAVGGGEMVVLPREESGPNLHQKLIEKLQQEKKAEKQVRKRTSEGDDDSKKKKRKKKRGDFFDELFSSS